MARYNHPSPVHCLTPFEQHFHTGKISTSFHRLYGKDFDSASMDFFTHSYWKKLPQSSRDYLSELEPPDLVFLLNDEQPKNIPPLFLLAFRHCTKTFSLSREMVDPTNSEDVSCLLKLEKDTEVPRAPAIKQDVRVLSSKPLTEKRRRDRINKCLVQLKNIIFRARGKEDKKFARLEKADILEMTIGHLMEIHGQETGRHSTSEEPSSNHDNRGQGHHLLKSTHTRDGQYLPPNNCLRKHVKPKKQHEIVRLGRTLHLLGMATKCPFIVDVGAGQGHLSRLLTFEYGFRVTTVEAAGCHAPKAQKFDRDVQKLIRKKQLKVDKKNECEDLSIINILPEHVTCFIKSDTSKSDFLEIVQKSFSENELEDSNSVYHSQNIQSTSCTTNRNAQKLHIDTVSKSMNNQAAQRNSSYSTEKQKNCASYVQGKEFILTGLHACGDLTTTMLRVFASCPEVVGIASVACCYMKLTDKSISSSQDLGYPMSRHLLQTHPGHSLSYEAREMACHFVDSYLERLQENKQSSLKLHCYRAMLQCIIHYINPTFPHGSVKFSMKNAENMEFQQYAHKGLQRLGLNCHVPDSVYEEIQSKLSQWKDVVAFYTLRLSLAPVVETIILLDRMLFLWENGIQSTLVPIFDPKISPRNFALLASKRNYQSLDCCDVKPDQTILL